MLVAFTRPLGIKSNRQPRMEQTASRNSRDFDPHICFSRIPRVLQRADRNHLTSVRFALDLCQQSSVLITQDPQGLHFDGLYLRSRILCLQKRVACLQFLEIVLQRTHLAPQLAQALIVSLVLFSRPLLRCLRGRQLCLRLKLREIRVQPLKLAAVVLDHVFELMYPLHPLLVYLLWIELCLLGLESFPSVAGAGVGAGDIVRSFSSSAFSLAFSSSSFFVPARMLAPSAQAFRISCPSLLPPPPPNSSSSSSSHPQESASAAVPPTVPDADLPSCAPSPLKIPMYPAVYPPQKPAGWYISVLARLAHVYSAAPGPAIPIAHPRGPPVTSGCRPAGFESSSLTEASRWSSDPEHPQAHAMQPLLSSSLLRPRFRPSFALLLQRVKFILQRVQLRTEVLVVGVGAGDRRLLERLAELLLSWFGWR
ncbi:hypothetical protein KC330_g148 [Hortaea werneckii]|nr:hypothetical protein KC330_g148 [Hortaea werneckii]